MSWKAHTKAIEVTTPAWPPPPPPPPPASTAEADTHRKEKAREPRALYPNSKATPDIATVKERRKGEVATKSYHDMKGPEMPSVADEGHEKPALEDRRRLNSDPTPAQAGGGSMLFLSRTGLENVT